MPLSDLNNINYWSVICHLNLSSKKQTNKHPPPPKNPGITVLADHVYIGFYKISLRQIWLWLYLLWHACIVWGRLFVKWHTAYGWSYGVEPPPSVFCFLLKTDFSGRRWSNLWLSLSKVAKRSCEYILPLIRAKCDRVESSCSEAAPVK